jgi:phosphoribosylformylglycinamidine (FGAM) synthase-like enzyme
VTLFSEDQGRAVVTCAPRLVDQLRALAAQHGVACQVLGETSGHRLIVLHDGSVVLDVRLDDVRAAWEPER